MRVVEVPAYGGPEVLRLSERPTPQPQAGLVRVRVAATTVNQADLKIRSGAAAGRLGELAPPFVLGFDFAGTLIDDAPHLPAGTVVAGFLPWFELGTGQGTYAEIVRVDPNWLAPVPEGVDLVRAASVPLSAQTAQQALDLLQLPDNSTVFVTGAGGVVGRFAVQHAAARGLHVIALTGTAEEHDLRELGAGHTVPRGAPDGITAHVLRLAPGGVDGILDTALLGDPLLPALRDNGSFVSATQARVPAPARGIQVSAVHGTPDGAQLKEILKRLATGELTTRVAGVLPLEQAVDAHRRAEAGGLPGRLVLTL
ncbi:NADPH:quinone reductase-like Zn-dependent oxidoreductase [Kitasatospora gansuensis]|uniref:NADPH:quinone reductase-like Zn-dependent oxidoreductase n=1 Tax=Kitasatospora gansuensis TaxID=258050 RepID=A0A7W7WFE1_9ACTN|nr:NADP-dependent oxidoreductase [Kitasatospora gansuensis]MBB4945181.1 NADPH:quinone reductase-like Zn-dependent oxidoreductase [Kitasatospora gansuensis]